MKTKSELTRNNFWIIAVNSTAAFILAYLSIFYLNHLSLILTSGIFGYPISVDYETISFHIEPFEWTHDAVKLMYGSGPILIFILGLIALVGYFSFLEEVAKIKILFLWFALIAMNHFFGGLMIGNLFTKGVGHVFNWMYLKDTQKMIIALVGFFGLLSTGLLMARPLAFAANSYFKKLSEHNFPFYFTSIIIVPFIVGNLVIIGYFMPDVHFQEKFGWISLAVILLLIFWRINSFDSIYFDEDDRKISLSYALIFTTIAVIVVFRTLLANTVVIEW